MSFYQGADHCENAGVQSGANRTIVYALRSTKGSFASEFNDVHEFGNIFGSDIAIKTSEFSSDCFRGGKLKPQTASRIELGVSGWFGCQTPLAP